MEDMFIHLSQDQADTWVFNWNIQCVGLLTHHSSLFFSVDEDEISEQDVQPELPLIIGVETYK